MGNFHGKSLISRKNGIKKEQFKRDQKNMGKAGKTGWGEKRKKGNFHGISLICRKSGIEKHRKNRIRNAGKW